MPESQSDTTGAWPSPTRRTGVFRGGGTGEANACRTVPRSHVMAARGGLVHLVGGNSAYTGSKLLVLRDLIRRTAGEVEYPFGVIVAVPNRHFVLYHIIEGPAVIAAINSMARFSADAFREGVSPVSPSVHWWRDGDLDPVAHVDDEGRSHIVAGGEFLRVLEDAVRQG